MTLSPAEIRKRSNVYIRDIHSHEAIAAYGKPLPEGALRQTLEDECMATGFDDIGIIETEEGDVVTVNNEPVAYIDMGFTDRLAIHEAVFPSRFLQAAE